MLWHVSKISPVYQILLLQFGKNINASKGVSEDGWIIKGLIALMFIQRWDQKTCWKGYQRHKHRLWLSFSYSSHFTLMSKVTMYITYFTTYFDQFQLRFISLYNIPKYNDLITYDIAVGLTIYTKQSAYRKQIYKL